MRQLLLYERGVSLHMGQIAELGIYVQDFTTFHDFKKEVPEYSLIWLFGKKFRKRVIGASDIYSCELRIFTGRHWTRTGWPHSAVIQSVPALSCIPCPVTDKDYYANAENMDFCKHYVEQVYQAFTELELCCQRESYYIEKLSTWSQKSRSLIKR